MAVRISMQGPAALRTRESLQRTQQAFPGGDVSTSVRTRRMGSVVILEPQMAHLDALAGLTLRSAIRSCAGDHHDGLVINLSRVASIDGAGLGSLVNGMQDSGSAGEFRVCAPQAAVRTRLAATALDRVVQVDDFEAQSLRAMRLALAN